MVSLAASNNYSPLAWAEVRSAMRDALRTPWVAAVAFVCLTLVCASLLGIVGWLLYANRDPAVIVSLVNTAINAFVLRQLTTMDGRVRLVEANTNGNHTRLMDAVVPKR